MALEFNTTEKKRKVPITRNNKFFSMEDYDLEMYFLKEYLEQDANQTIILYQVDLDSTKVSDIYSEANQGAVRFKTPIELPVVYDIADAEMKAYNNKLQKGLYAQTGKLTFSILLTTLEENHCDISRGDYIGVQISPEHREFFVVTDDGRVNAMSNKFTKYGTQIFARTIVAASVDTTEFNG